MNMNDALREFLERCAGAAGTRAEMRAQARSLLCRTEGASEGPWCPNCSMPRRPLHFNGEVWRCTHCNSWWTPATLRDPSYAPLFRRGGPAGFDPESGFEAQALPKAAKR